MELANQKTKQKQWIEGNRVVETECVRLMVNRTITSGNREIQDSGPRLSWESLPYPRNSIELMKTDENIPGHATCAISKRKISN